MCLRFFLLLLIFVFVVLYIYIYALVFAWHSHDSLDFLLRKLFSWIFNQISKFKKVLATLLNMPYFNNPLNFFIISLEFSTIIFLPAYTCINGCLSGVFSIFLLSFSCGKNTWNDINPFNEFLKVQYITGDSRYNMV